jgi:SRSO17 transposase
VHSAWRIEQGYKQVKGELGWADFQVRRYDAWYRHVTLVLVAHGFLAAVRAHAAAPARAGAGGG